jgi:hypothetical protein
VIAEWSETLESTVLGRVPRGCEEEILVSP